MLIERFKSYLNKVFSGVADAPEVRDLREEMLGNLMSRAMELKEEGLSEEEIYDKCVKSVGDYTDTLRALKTSPVWRMRDKRTQGGILLFLLAVLLCVFLYLALGFLWNLWGIAAIVIFPTLAVLGYIVPTAFVLASNFKLKRHFTTELILCSYVAIATTALFFILAFATPVGAWRAWCVFPALPALLLGTVMCSLKWIRKKRIPFLLVAAEILLIGVGLYLIFAAITWLFHPLWIIIPAALAVDLLLAAIRLFRSRTPRTEQN